MVSEEHDLDAQAMYLKVAEGTVRRTREIDPGTMVDVDAGGKLLGIEVINPGRCWPLAAILRDYGVSDEDAAVLMAGYPHGVTVSVA